MNARGAARPAAGEKKPVRRTVEGGPSMTRRRVGRERVVFCPGLVAIFEDVEFEVERLIRMEMRIRG
jgi:hypothetical protein